MSALVTEIAYAWAPRVPEGIAPVYASTPYQAMLATHDHVEPRVLACTAGGRTAYLPMLVRDLGGGCREAYSAYGYGGLVGEVALSTADVEGLQQHLADDGIVALFLRHSPFLANARLWPDGMARLNRHTYAVDLWTDASLDATLARIPQKLRWSANFARRAGLQVAFHPLDRCPLEKVDAFYEEYRALMTQKDTSPYYFFSGPFFRDHATRLQASCELAEVTDADGRFLGGAMFLLDDTGWVHYHLSAARPEAMKLQSMELLMLSAIQHFGARGVRSLHLGGGHALDQTDGLSRFKSKFATRTLDFHCSTLVCDNDGYQRQRAARPLAHPSFFLIADAR